MKKCCLIVLIFLVIFIFPLSAQPKLTIKLASLVPENSPWGAALNGLALEWSQLTNGEVKLIIFHGGTAGDESEALRKLNLNQVQIALLTSMGLNRIVPEILTLSYPLLIRDNDEFEEVFSRLRPELNQKFQGKNYVTLAWAKAGWVKIFSKAPVFVPADLRRQKLGSSPDELEMMQAFRAMGYQIIPVSLNDVLVSLKSGMADAVYMSPIAVASGQYFGIVPNMSSLNVAPFMGALVMNQAAWRRIPEKYRPALQASCKRLEDEINASFAVLEDEAVSTMLRHGLTINTLNAQQEQEWIDDIVRQESKLAGPIFDGVIYRKIKDILNEYRKGQ